MNGTKYIEREKQKETVTMMSTGDYGTEREAGVTGSRPSTPGSTRSRSSPWKVSPGKYATKRKAFCQKFDQ
jgi:hypothetical protein